MAAVELVLMIVVLSLSSDIVSGVEFLEKPDNVTLKSSWKQFTLKCEVDAATPNGMDWTAEISGAEKTEVCWSIPLKSEVNCKAGYSVERPNNRTINLIVHFRNSSVAGKYCCYPDNGQGTPACSYVTVSDVSQSPHTDVTEANEVTATVNTATSTYLSTAPSALTPEKTTGIIVGVLGFVILVIILVICICHPGCPIRRRLNNCSAQRNGVNTEETGVRLTNSVMETTTTE